MFGSIKRKLKRKKNRDPFRVLVNDITVGAIWLAGGGYSVGLSSLLILERLTRGNVQLLTAGIIRLSLIDLLLVGGFGLLGLGAWYIQQALKKYKKDAWLLEY